MERWVNWATRLQAIAQAGLEYSEGPYDRERYVELRTIAAEIITEHTDHDHEHVSRFLESELGYATPKVDVRGVVLRDGRVLLVRERNEGRWSLPGGWAEIHLTASENAVKEIREESGYEAKAIRLLAIYDRSRHDHGSTPSPYSIYKIFFLCELTGGEPGESLETSGAEFFSPDALPELSTMRVTGAQIHRMIELARTGGVDFD